MLPPPAVLGLIASLMILSDPITLRYYWRRWDSRELAVLVPTTLGGVVVGTWLLAVLSELALRRLIGGGALVFAIVQLVASARRRPLTARASWRAGAAVGLVTGIASSVAHSGGVVMGLYLVARRLLGYRVNRVLPRRTFELVLIGIASVGAVLLLVGV